MPQPFSVMAGAFTAYVAIDGTIEPLNLSATPTTPWAVLGVNGSKDYDEDGITISPDDTREVFRGLGGTGIRKQWRTEEDLTAGFKVYDATPEHVAKVFGTTLITTATAVATSASKAAPLKRGQLVSTMALLLRGDGGGPYADGQPAQFWFPRVSVGDIGELVSAKGTPMGTELTFEVWDHETLGFGNYRAASAGPTP